jgi:hypothetical protein
MQKNADKNRAVNIAAWTISIASVCLAIIAWFDSYNWNLPRFSTYILFPLFGLIAFSLMWSHYIASVIRQMAGLNKQTLSAYFETTSLIVLAAIFLHPGLLIWQLWRDGNGLPPGSVYDFVGMSMRFSATLGIVSLLIFLAYEFRRLFDKKPWWKFVGYATDAAMIMIFYHGLRLGGQLNSGWYLAVWMFYGVTLVLSLIYIHSIKVRQLIDGSNKNK